MLSSFSSLARTMIFCNVAAFFLLALPYFWPLPGEQSRPVKLEEKVIEAETSQVTEINVASVLERPLFQLNRRRAKSAPKPEVKAPVTRERQITPYELVGVVGSKDSQRKAYLYNKNSQQTVSISVGQDLDGWIVMEISDRMITLGLGEKRRSLELAN